MKYALMLILTAVLLFSAYGFLASFEPTETSPVHTGWMIGYGVVGLGSILGLVTLALKGKKPD